MQQRERFEKQYHCGGSPLYPVGGFSLKKYRTCKKIAKKETTAKALKSCILWRCGDISA
jgi:hypothetical protein